MSVQALEWATKQPGLTRLEKTVLKEIANRYNEAHGGKLGDIACSENAPAQ